MNDMHMFHIDGALPSYSEEYIERDVEHRAQLILQQRRHFRIIGHSQQGKTSLIYWLKEHVRSYRFAVIDLRSLSETDEERWYEDLKDRLLAEIDFIPSKESKDIFSSGRSSWRGFLAEIAKRSQREQKPLVIVLDNFNRISLQMYPWALSCINVLYDVFEQRQRENETHFAYLTFILSGRDYSPDRFVRMTEIVHLDDFKFEQVRFLVEFLGLSDREAKTIAHLIYNWTNGQPYLTHYLCAFLAAQPGKKNIRKAIQQLYDRDQLHFQSILGEIQEFPGLEAFARQFFTEQIPIFHVRQKLFKPELWQLDSAGLIKFFPSEGRYRLRNKIYTEFFATEYKSPLALESSADSQQDDEYAILEIHLRSNNKENGATDHYHVLLSYIEKSSQLEPVTDDTSIDFDVLLNSSPEILEYARVVHRVLFEKEGMKGAFIGALTRNKGKLRVRLHIESDDSRLHMIRWEAMLHPGAYDDHLLMDEQIPFSRFLSVSDIHSFTDYSPVPMSQQKALLVIANPIDIAQLNPLLHHLNEDEVQENIRRVQKSLGRIPCTVLCSTPGLPGHVTLDHFIEELHQGYTLLYVLCHGALRTRSGVLSPHIYLEESKKGRTKIITVQEIQKRLRAMDSELLPHLVILGSCKSAGNENYSPGNRETTTICSHLAPALIRARVPSVIGMQGDVSLETLTEFIPKVFEELCKNRQLDRAMAVARGHVREKLDWWMPVLFTRVKNGRL